MVVALVAIPLSVAWFILGVVLFGSITPVVGLAAGVTMVLAPIGLWMGALVAKHAWTRSLLAFCTALLFIVGIFSVYVFMDGLEEEAIGGCTMVETADGGAVQQDADLCEYLEDGSFQRERNLSYLSLGVFWVGPLVALYALRRRFQPEDRL